MLFPKDHFTKNLQQLRIIIKDAEDLLARTENGNDTKTLAKIEKSLECAPRLLSALHDDIKSNDAKWNEDILRERKGYYENILTRYIDVRQTVEAAHHFKP